MRVIFFVSGIFPIAAGIFFLINEGQTFDALAFVAGVALLAYGILGAAAYFVARRASGAHGWTLANGLSAMSLASLALLGRLTDDAVALSAFGAWIMAVGASYVAGGADMRGEKPAFRLAMVVMGLLCAAMGAYGVFRPFLPDVGMTGIIGGTLIMQGVSAFAFGAGVGRERRESNG
jgi:uncharacterized membrane protein HdeD (DUF308 family)